MLMFSFEAATTRSRSAFSRSSTFGLITNSPLTRAILTSDMGPLKGISDTVNADEAASAANASGITPFSPEIKEINTCVSA